MPERHSLSLRQIAGVIAASALVTFDGTGATIALPAIGAQWGAHVVELRWIANAPLLVLAALLLPSGAVADRFGRVRVMRAGLVLFALASLGAAASRSAVELTACRLCQGVGGALILPAALAVLRSSADDPAARARVLGTWAAWTGAAAVLGPLLAGMLVDRASWRGVFLVSAVLAVAATVSLDARHSRDGHARVAAVPARATAGMVALLGGTAFLLMHPPTDGVDRWTALAALGMVVGGFIVTRSTRRSVLFPRELLTAPNCMPANAVTFALYFGMFGMSFVVALYTQQRLGYSAFLAAVALAPMSLMLLLAERFGRATSSFGSRTLVAAGALVAAAGLAWMGAGSHPLSFWSRIVSGSALFGLGTAVAVSALTHAAVAAVPVRCAGAASGLNHAIVRLAGLSAVALLGAVAAPGASDTVSPEGVRLALLTAAAVVAAGALVGASLLRDRAPGGVAPETPDTGNG